jgi:hypothetical protein
MKMSDRHAERDACSIATLEPWFDALLLTGVEGYALAISDAYTMRDSAGLLLESADCCRPNADALIPFSPRPARYSDC